jgi:hypothetical protein
VARVRKTAVAGGRTRTPFRYLETELAAVERVFGGLSEDEWRLPTKLVAVDPTSPHWTVFELAGHFDIAIALTRMLIAGADSSQPARDRTRFFINPRSETGQVVYDYAYKMVEGKTPPTCPVLHETFSGTVAEARAVPASAVGSRSAKLRTGGGCRDTSRRCGSMNSCPAASSRPSCTAST